MLLALVVDGLHAGEESGVQADIVVVRRHERRCLSGDALQLGLVLAPASPEDRAHLRQEEAARVQRRRVLAKVGLAACSRWLRFRRRDANALLYGRQKVFVPDAIERRRVEGRSHRQRKRDYP